MLQIRARLYTLAARRPFATLFIAVSLSCAVVCAVILATGFIALVFLDCTIGFIASFVADCPETFSWLTQIIWRMVWMTSIVVCGFCGMFNFWIIASSMVFVMEKLYTKEILPFYTLFVATIETKVREEQAKERVRNQRVTRKILEQLLCADIAGEVARFADFRDSRYSRISIVDA